MASADYWDDRAKTRSGFARSVWHSQSFSEAWDERQQTLLRGALTALDGPLAGRRVADVGCGTGRITRFLAREGAVATGFDFSPETVRVAGAETREAGLEATFVVADATTGALPVADGSFDLSLAVGCLAVACRDLDALERALGAMRAATRPGGAVVLLEPIHDGRFFGRVLREPVEGWVSSARRAGLRLVDRRGMGLLPVRAALSSFDAPPWLVRPVFAAGEGVLDASAWLEPLADYRLLSFRVA
ncbi:MAG: class I SAM-dependent methyltransferase [Polyangiaceae bacterium]|nr:class I SAM-dependent methyltransferase [Polyangiaceae bacterium]